MLEVLRRYKLYSKRSKCQFFHTLIEYLGHVLYNVGALVDSKNIKIVVRWPTPKNKIEAMCFLGWTIYMRKYVRDQGCSPVTYLMKRKF